MVAEGKKSSHRAQTGQFQNSRAGFRLHYFPDIPVDDPGNVRACLPPEDKFQRIRYAGRGTDCSDLTSESETDSGLSNRNSASAERFDAQAYQEGFKDGLEKGTTEGETAGFDRATQKLEPLLDSLQQGLLQLANLRRETYQRIENEVVELALAVARKIICREIELDKEVVVCVAREALAKVEAPGKIKLKMNPADIHFIESTQYSLSDLIGNIDNVTLEAEDGIQSGGCIIETDMGEIDARIENQLQAVEESFRSTLEKSTAKT